MTVSREVELEILRLVDAEKLLPGTAASLVGVHHDVVDRVVEQEVTGRAERAPRVSKLAPYHGLLCETLKQYPTIGATRLATMARERGFDGSDRIVQRYVCDVRPKPSGRAYLVCERLPGEQAQIDWGHVGRIAVAGGFRALWVFVLYLAYSRMRYAELVLDLTAESLRRSLVRAITFLVSPAVCMGTTFAGITGDQVPTTSSAVGCGGLLTRERRAGGRAVRAVPGRDG